MVYNDYLEIITENYDLSDPYTFDKLIMCNESEKQSVIVHLTNKLYNNIKANVDNIDFGTIPLSKGNIAKIENYENLIDCVNTMHSLIKEYGQKTDQIDAIYTAIDNIKNRTRVWEKAFALNIEFPIMIYNTTVLSIVSSVSLMITTCIQYIKNGDDTIKAAFDKAAYIKNKDHVLFQSLQEFNTICVKGDLDKLINGCIQMNAKVIKESFDDAKGALVSTVQSAIGGDPKSVGLLAAVLLGLTAVINMKYLLKYLINGIRRGVYYFMFLRQNVADYFTVQADFLQINAENLQYRDMDDSKRDKVKDRQMKWVNKFRSWANFFMIKDKKARNDADKKEKEDSKQKRSQDEDDGGLF